MKFYLSERCRKCNHHAIDHVPFMHTKNYIEYEITNELGETFAHYCTFCRAHKDNCLEFIPKDNLKYLEMLSERNH